MTSQPRKTLTVSLSPSQEARFQTAVESGTYSSDEEIVREALRLWEVAEDQRLTSSNTLKRAYEEGMASGPGRVVDVETFLDELKTEAQGRG